MRWVGHGRARRPAGGRRAPRRARADDAGSSLVEVVVSIGVLGTAGAGLLFALISAIKGAGDHQQMATVQARLGAAGEIVHSADVDYVPCSTTPAAVAAAYSGALATELPGPAGGVEVLVDQVTFWNGTSFVASCSGIPADALQMVLITATHGSISIHQTVTKLPGPVLP